MIGLLRQKIWNKSLEEITTHMLNILKRLHERGDCNCAKILTLKKKDVCETTW
jgi:hypothetical protein